MKEATTTNPTTNSNPLIGIVVFLAVILAVMLATHRAHETNKSKTLSGNNNKNALDDEPSLTSYYDNYYNTNAGEVNGETENLENGLKSSSSASSASSSSSQQKQQQQQQSSSSSKPSLPIKKKKSSSSSSSASSAAININNKPNLFKSQVRRIFLISYASGGGVGQMYTALSKMCLGGMYSYHAMTYSPSDMDSKYFPVVNNNDNNKDQIFPNGLYRDDNEFNFVWAKNYMIRRAISEYKLGEDDWVVWTDHDVWVVNPQKAEKSLRKIILEGIISSTSSSSSSSSSVVKKHLIVGSDSEDGINTKAFAIRATSWSKKFLDSWFADQNKVFYGKDAGPFIHALLREASAAYGKTYNNECVMNDKKRDDLPSKSQKEFWKNTDFKTPFLKCVRNYVEKNLLMGENENSEKTKLFWMNTCPTSSNENENTDAAVVVGGGLLPKFGWAVGTHCELNVKKFSTENLKKNLLVQGEFDKFQKLALDIGERFNPRCY